MEYWIGLGSNVGDSRQHIASAVTRLGDLPGTELLQCSSCYCSPPWGFTEQRDFTNAVALLHSELEPGQMLTSLKAVETVLGREPGGRRWGPRMIDLDLLLADDLIIHRAGLEVPHPRMHRRAFVLVPLAELAPDLIIPARGRLQYLLARLPRQAVRRLAAA